MPIRLPGGLTMDEFLERRKQSRIAGTGPLPLLSWSGRHWLLPRACVELLDRWERVEDDLAASASSCSGCRAQGPRWGGWRTPTKDGYVTWCPPCSDTAFQPYPGHLRGVLYAALRNVRGPLYARCNTLEGMGIPDLFLRRQGGALHLLECRGCTDQRAEPGTG